MVAAQPPSSEGQACTELGRRGAHAHVCTDGDHRGKALTSPLLTKPILRGTEYVCPGGAMEGGRSGTQLAAPPTPVTGQGGTALGRWRRHERCFPARGRGRVTDFAGGPV